MRRWSARQPAGPKGTGDCQRMQHGRNFARPCRGQTGLAQAVARRTIPVGWGGYFILTMLACNVNVNVNGYGYGYGNLCEFIIGLRRTLKTSYLLA